MKKTLVALAAVAATSAFAQVEIYGRAHLAVDSWSATGATDSTKDMVRRTRVIDNGSRIGFRINENIGGGLRTFALIEGGINIDNPSELDKGQSGAANSGTGGFGTREAHVGIGNNSLELRLGRQNVYWGNGSVEDVGSNHLTFGGVGVFTAQSSGFVTAPAARQDNTIQLFVNKDMAGNFAGSSVWYSTPNLAERTAANLPVRARAQGATIKYASGPWSVQYDYGLAMNTTNDTAATNRNNTGNKFGVAYQMGATKLSGHYFKMEREYSDSTTNIAALTAGTSAAAGGTGGGSQSGFGASITHAMGNYVAYAQFATLGRFNHVSRGEQADTGTSAYSLGLRQNLSKRSWVYASYNVVSNEAAAFVNMSGGGYSSAGATGVGAGADQKSLALGLFHNF